ncbi:MAG: hypothetical protein QM820_59505 [Minicystis sp.]
MIGGALASSMTAPTVRICSVPPVKITIAGSATPACGLTGATVITGVGEGVGAEPLALQPATADARRSEEAAMRIVRIVRTSKGFAG